MDLKGLSPDVLAEALAQQGYSQEEIEATVGPYALARYQPKTASLQPTFQVLSDKEVMIGNDSHTLRVLNAHDLKSILPVVMMLAAHLVKNGDVLEDTVNDFLEKGVLNFMDVLLKKMDGLLGTEYPEWFVSVLEKLAELVSTEKRAVSAGDLISMPVDQQAELIKKLWEVNQKHFLLFWAMVPVWAREVIGLKIFIPASEILSAVRESLNPSQSQGSEAPSSGGH